MKILEGARRSFLRTTVLGALGMAAARILPACSRTETSRKKVELVRIPLTTDQSLSSHTTVHGFRLVEVVLYRGPGSGADLVVEKLPIAKSIMLRDFFTGRDIPPYETQGNILKFNVKGNQDAICIDEELFLGPDGRRQLTLKVNMSIKYTYQHDDDPYLRAVSVDVHRFPEIRTAAGVPFYSLR